MKFQQRTEYALRALIELAVRPDAYTCARQIADAQRIPPRFAEQILADLRRGGLVDGQRGREGGSKLARDPAAITVGEVIDLVEGPVVTQASLDPFDDAARRAAHSAVQELWLDLQITIRDRLSRTTIADLAVRQGRLDAAGSLAFQI